jgi:hypothetical protein
MTNPELELPDNHNVVRYVGFTGLRDNGRVDGSQFCPSPGSHGLSVNWLEYFDCPTKEQQIAGIRRLIHRTRGRKAVFAEINVGDVRSYLANELSTVRFVNTPAQPNCRFPDPDPTHCDIMGLPPAEAGDGALVIGDMIAKRVKTLYPAVVPAEG